LSVYHPPQPSHTFQFDHGNNIWSRVNEVPHLIFSYPFAHSPPLIFR
jgi:hypothetical protein